MTAIEALKCLQDETKASVYIVGGFVRDYLINSTYKQNKDLDVVICKLSLKKIKNYLSKFGKIKEINIAKTQDIFSTNMLLFKSKNDSFNIKINLPKRWKKQIPHQNNTLKQDMRFRDFKINSMYIPINYKDDGDIIDFIGGKLDIKSKKISTNGSATERIKESPIRMLRAISLASETNFTIDSNLIRAIKINNKLILKCSKEAIRKEFNKILLSKKPSKYLKFLNKVGLLKLIAPELYNCIGVKQDKKYHKYDVFTHLIYTCDNCQKNLIMRLAGVLHDVGKPATKKEIIGDNNEVKVTFYNHEIIGTKIAKTLLSNLKYDKNTINKVLYLIKFHMYHFTREWSDSAIRKFIKRTKMPDTYLNYENIENFPLFQLRVAERKGNGLKTIGVTKKQLDFEKKLIEVHNKSKSFSIKDLKINGNVIMDTFKILPGIHVGKTLKYLLNKVLKEPELNNELELLKLTTEYLYNNNFIKKA